MLVGAERKRPMDANDIGIPYVLTCAGDCVLNYGLGQGQLLSSFQNNDKQQNCSHLTIRAYEAPCWSAISSATKLN
jgi:hypothetical protein